MGRTPVPEKITALSEVLAPIAAAHGLELDGVTLVGRAPLILRVTVDAPLGAEGVDSDALAEVSREVSRRLDEVDPIDGEYLLEVSTPGAERELTEPRHWRRQVGRLVQARLKDGTVLVGRLVEAGEEEARLDVDGEATTIAYEHVKKARPRVELGSDSDSGE